MRKMCVTAMFFLSGLLVGHTYVYAQDNPKNLSKNIDNTKDILSNNTTQRIKMFDTVSKALGRYKADMGKYPVESVDGITTSYVGWSQEKNKRTGFNLLVPKYLSIIPKDPRLNDSQYEQYIYISNGKDYKFIAHSPEDVKAVISSKPSLIDPARPTWAYGIWTPGAAKF
jgi:hypothetical protein